MEKTMRFAIREGGKTVGAGRISEILDLVPRSSSSSSASYSQSSSYSYSCAAGGRE